MKDLIIKALDNLQAELSISQDKMNRIQVLSAQELSDIECSDSLEDSFEIWDKYYFAVLYSDHPDYCFFRKETMSYDEIVATIKSWHVWDHIIQ